MCDLGMSRFATLDGRIFEARGPLKTAMCFEESPENLDIWRSSKGTPKPPPPPVQRMDPTRLADRKVRAFLPEKSVLSPFPEKWRIHPTFQLDNKGRLQKSRNRLKMEKRGSFRASKEMARFSNRGRLQKSRNELKMEKRG